MNQFILSDTLSRIDKLFLDQYEVGMEESRNRRAQNGFHMLVGDDVKTSYGLQLALLTAVNLGVKCFATEAIIQASSEVWLAPCLVPLVKSVTLGEAVAELGGRPVVWTGALPISRFLILGDAQDGENAIRITYDGWRIKVGPTNQVERMAERPYCPLASIAAAAIAVGEVFAEFAKISITASRRIVALSLWRPDLSLDHPDGIGEHISELPLSLGTFGLGHLGQAYLWCLAALPYSARHEVRILLCDDDVVENVNIETGALLKAGDGTHLKTRVAAEWLEARGFATRLLERRIDENFRRTSTEPVIALSGFDDNLPRHWLSQAGFEAMFDSGLGGEAHNFDTISFHGWPNPRSQSEIWPQESDRELAARETRKKHLIAKNSAYRKFDADECGRVLIAGKSVAVPFVGAVASCIVMSEMLKSVNGGPVFSDLKLRLCSSGVIKFDGRLESEGASPIRGLATQKSLELS